MYSVQRFYILFSLFILTRFAASSQSVDSLYRKVEGFGIGLPQEKVYLHIDNTCYFIGDTIWYKGYVTRSDKGTLTDLSKILYVELLTPDGFLVERQQLEMPDGTAHGAFVLTDSLYAGYYELRAYTRWMLNFGINEYPHIKSSEEYFFTKKMAKEFFRDFDKLYGRVFPVYDKPDTMGIYIKDMTRRPMRRYFKERKGKPELSLKFFPEGGTLIEGTTCRVAYELNSDEGEHLDAELIITDRHGNEILRSSTAHRGRGVFTLPKVSGNYKARFRYKEYDYEFKLPESEHEGISLIAEQKDSTLTVRLERTEHLNIFPGGLALHVMNGGVSKYFSHINFPESDSTKLSIPLSQLPTGVNQLTVHDGEGRIYADRLVFVRHAELPLTTLQVEGLKNQYAPYEEIEIKLSLNDTSAITNSHVSLSVRDRSTDEPSHDDGTILTEMLLGSELKGFVESPGYYFEMDDSIHRSHLDLLMMVQGWRRYEWRKMADVERFDLPYLPEKFQTIGGCVNKHRNHFHLDEMNASNLKNEVNVWAMFAQGKDVYELMQPTNRGIFYFRIPKIYGAYTLFLSAAKQAKGIDYIIKNRQKNFMDGEEYSDFYVKLDYFYPFYVKPYSYYQDSAPERIFNEGDDAPSVYDFTNRALKTVVIKNKRNGLRKYDKSKPAMVIDANEAYNMFQDYGMYSAPVEFLNPSVLSTLIAQLYIGDMDLYRSYNVQTRYNGRPMCLNALRPRMVSPIQSTLDIIETDYMFATNINKDNKFMSRFDKCYIYTDYCPREMGSWKYQQDNQPEVIIDLRTYPNDGYYPMCRDRRIILKGYSVCDDFYSPDYSQKPLPEVKDYRRTLLWMPSVRFNQNGQAIVRLYNNSKPSVLSIEAEGITVNGDAVVYKAE